MVLLAIERLVVRYDGGRPAVDGFDLQLDRGQTFGLLGPSGAGKSTVGHATIAMLPASARTSGQVRVDGVSWLQAAERRALRGHVVAHVAQSPAAALNPSMKIGRQVAEVVALRERWRRPAARDFAVARLEEVGLSSAAVDAWPHELSGGQQRRAVLAMALATDPALLVADEPTASLDALLRSEMAALLAGLVAQRRLALLLITHDVELAAALCDRFGVLAAGRLIERGHMRPFAPRHPYTASLADAAGILADGVGQTLSSLVADHRSSAPSFRRTDIGCGYAGACPWGQSRCREQAPPWNDGARCFFPLHGHQGEAPSNSD